MAALPPRTSRRRPRRGSLERPVSGRLYRGTWLLVGIPLLVAAFSVHKPNPLPTPQPALPASFDTFDAVSRLDHAKTIAFERIGEELLNRVLVIDEQDGGRIWHRGACRRTSFYDLL